MPISRQSIRSLSRRQREFLRLHIDGPVQVTISSHATRSALTAKGLLRSDRPIHPRHTFLTADGRYAIAVILGDAADALVSAGVLDAEVAAIVSARITAREKITATAAAPAISEQIMPAIPL